MCKHVAAVLYGVGARLDQSPELFFVLRQVDQAELIAGTHAVKALVDAAGLANTGKKPIASSSVAAVFGIELDDAPAPPPRKKAKARTTVASKSTTDAKKAASKQTAARRKSKANKSSGR